MAAVYVDEDEVWKCPTHPSKRRRYGICPICLKERLVSLCPECANVRPCACCPATSSSSSSSSSSSFSRSLSRFSSRFAADASAGVGSVGRVSNLVENEPSFRRSRSVAVPFLRSRFGGGDKDLFSGERKETPAGSRSKKAAFLSIFRPQKSKRSEVVEDEVEAEVDVEVEVEDEAAAQRRRMMMKSRSVAVTTDSGVGDVRPSKGRGWHFPSPIKAFRQSRISKVVQERSPLYRG